MAEAVRICRPLDQLSVATLNSVVDDLRRLGGFGLTRTAVGLGEKGPGSRPLSLDELLAN